MTTYGLRSTELLEVKHEAMDALLYLQKGIVECLVEQQAVFDDGKGLLLPVVPHNSSL